MNSTLYLYDEHNFFLLKEELTDYDFFDIAFFLDSFPNVTDIKSLDESRRIVIDISDLFQDNNYFRIFTARYIRTLSSKIPNLIFCMRTSLRDVVKLKFPILYTEFDVNMDFSAPQNTEAQKDSSLRLITLPIYTYENFSNIKNSSNVISIVHLIEESEGITIKFNLKEISILISENNIEFIDISSLIKIVKLRHDLILQFEVLLLKIARAHNIKFCVDVIFIENIQEEFPCLFFNQIKIDEPKQSTKKESPVIEINVKELENKIDKICQTLKGHDAFKVDFRRNFIKYNFLNQMRERKILSILLCGSSGIGKTEFAKIASDILYPNEPLIKINFGNYSTDGVLNSLIGSPLGYVGSEEGGELINKIRKSNSKIILIDEFEKATPSVYNFFYELLEDGVFTDRHGTSHDLNGYIIVFTSNMSQSQYSKHIPDSLKSRFDMVYYFVDVPLEEKKAFIDSSSKELIAKLNDCFKTHINETNIQPQLEQLLKMRNLRDIKRKIEDIVFIEFFNVYSKGLSQ